MIYGTLGYFISPIDAIPDFIPGGYTDDLGILAVAVVSLTLYITEDIKAKAAKMMKVWFGDRQANNLDEDAESISLSDH